MTSIRVDMADINNSAGSPPMYIYPNATSTVYQQQYPQGPGPSDPSQQYRPQQYFTQSRAPGNENYPMGVIEPYNNNSSGLPPSYAFTSAPPMMYAPPYPPPSVVTAARLQQQLPHFPNENSTPPQAPDYYAGSALPQQQQQQQQPSIIVVSQPPTMTMVLGDINRWSRSPTMVTCPTCHDCVVSAVSYVTGLMSWMICLLMCFFGLWPCMFIPFCVDSCKDVVHTCPSCNTVLGRHSIVHNRR